LKGKVKGFADIVDSGDGGKERETIAEDIWGPDEN
jgi:hypothetical protein